MGRDFRPRKFKEVVGQLFVKQIIQGGLSGGSFPQISLFTGDSGVGKSSLAEVVAMSLTCEQMGSDGEPCGICESCRVNLKCLESGENNSGLVKVNVGLLLGKKDVVEIVKDIFVLQPRVGRNSVYVLEEIHALGKAEQIPFLEEMEKVPEGVYIIMCTTQPNRLIPELRGRATRLELKRPGLEECYGLVDRVCSGLGVVVPGDKVKRMLVQRVGNVPREIVKTIRLLASGVGVTEWSVREYLGVVGFGEYLTLLEKATGDMFEFVEYLQGLEGKGISYVNIVKGLKEFFMDVVMYIYGTVQIDVDNKSKGRLRKVCSEWREEKFLDVLEFVGGVGDDGFYDLLMFRRKLMGRGVKEVFKESKRSAMKTVLEGERRYNAVVAEQEVEEGGNDVRNEELSLEYVQELTGSLAVSKIKKGE